MSDRAINMCLAILVAVSVLLLIGAGIGGVFRERDLAKRMKRAGYVQAVVEYTNVWVRPGDLPAILADNIEVAP